MTTTRATRLIPLLSISLLAACEPLPFDMAANDFADIVSGHPEGAPFEDAHVDHLLSRLDSLLDPPEDDRASMRQAMRYLRGFRWALEQGRARPEQSKRVFAHLDALKAEHPGAAEMIDEQRHLFEVLNPGHVAQNIAGTDTDGVEFELEDYRGNIVVLVFSGEWCGPCRAEYPYQRKLMEQFKDENVVLLGVNSDKELETIREAKVREELHYRTWWDGSTRGPISTAWSVWKWPTTYILDEEGVIRFVDKRADGMIEAVAEMLEETRAGDST